MSAHLTAGKHSSNSGPGVSGALAWVRSGAAALNAGAGGPPASAAGPSSRGGTPRPDAGAGRLPGCRSSPARRPAAQKAATTRSHATPTDRGNCRRRATGAGPCGCKCRRRCRTCPRRPLPQSAAPAAVATAPPLAARENFAFAPYWTLPQSGGFDLTGLSTLAYFAIGVSPEGNLEESGPGGTATRARRSPT
jgi:hypothetical protein